MAMKKSVLIVLIGLLISAWLLWSISPALAETVKFNGFNAVSKYEAIPVGDQENHDITLIVREGVAFLDNGEFATTRSITTGEDTKGEGSYNSTLVWTFRDGSTLTIRSHGFFTPTTLSVAGETEIIKGTGRFEGIKGTMKSTNKRLPLQKGERYSRLVSEGTLTYTLPQK